MMTFSTDPSMGLSNDHFSGSAIVFLSTITYAHRVAAVVSRVHQSANSDDVISG
jgi:hypothetical protein